MARKRDKPGILFVTISGAQGTGKSTLASDLCAKLNKDHGRGCAIFVPSFTGRLFSRMRKGELNVTSTVLGEDRKPRSYGEIDTFGLRRWYQTNLPSACAFEVESVLLSIKSAARKRPLYFIVLDRWFPDILAYTRIEAGDDRTLPDEVASLCRDTYQSILMTATETVDGAPVFGPISEVNVFVPIASSDFEIVGQDGKFRATCDRDMFERHCLSAWEPTLGRRKPHLSIAEADRMRRLDEVIHTIDATRAHRV